MICFPESTLVHRRMPKEAFYQRLNLTPVLKEKFVSDVDRIVVENSLTKENLNLTADSDMKEILVLVITLKKQEFDGKVVEAIARQNPHKLLFLLCYDNRIQLALYQGKLYYSPWQPESEIQLEARGQSIGEIWDSFIEQIALTEVQADAASGISVEERLKLLDKKEKLEKQISALQQKLRKEKQFNKQVQLNAELKRLRKELGEML